MKYLVIVESPAKEKTISKILGGDWTVLSSYGHIRDLPKSVLGINVDDNFEPTYVDIPKAKKAIVRLRKVAGDAQKVFLATDLDREGEAIAWHLKEALALSDSKTERITFHEITPEAIRESVKNPRKLNMGLVNSQQARRILDRIVGYKLSPLLWKKVKTGLSAGRVQSAAVMIICDREEEINKFTPIEYWSVEANLSKQDESASFKAALYMKGGQKQEKMSLKNKEEADEILKSLEGASYKVENIDSKQRRRSPYPPYTTSSLQQDASRRIGFSASKTMTIAQSLYEGVNIAGENIGLITYMRTDSLNIAKSAQAEAVKFITSNYGDNFVPPSLRFYKSKSRGAQEAHEAIRPTSPSRAPQSIKHYLSHDEFRLYELIWMRFMASQMADAVYNTVSVDISAKDCIFRATGSSLVFDGFMKVYNIEDGAKDMNLPPLETGEGLTLIELLANQHFTEAPPRYNEASLIKALEEHGIGRPSTYAPTIKTILDRLYVKLESKKFYPTPLGIVVNDVLKKHFGNIINLEFTAGIEEKFDDIAENQSEWQSVIKDFYAPFMDSLEKAESNLTRQKVEAQKSDVLCPKCGKPMVIRISRNGEFLGCSGYPDCKTALSMGKDGKPASQGEQTDMKCDKCQSPLIKKAGFRGKSYLVCGNETCKAKYNIDKAGNKVLKPEPEKTDIKCQKCGSMMLKRKSAKGDFLTCSAFPRCKNLQWIKNSEKKSAPKRKKSAK
jgi:DNA topoisomerase-1